MFRFHSTILRATAIAGALAAFPVAASAEPAAATPAAMAMEDQSAAQCTAPVAPTGPLASWAAPHRKVTAATMADAASKATLTLGEAADVMLAPTPKITYALQPAKPGGTVSFGGILAFDVAEAGNYRVALNDRAWIDVVANGAAATSIAHGHGPECSGVTKMVDYTLQPGRHLLQFAASGDVDISVMVMRLP